MCIVYVLAKFPNLTETFILNEISELKRYGVDIKVLAVNEGDSFSGYQEQREGIEIIYFYKHLSFKNFKAHSYLITNSKWIYFNVLFEILCRHKISIRNLLSDIKAFSIAGYFLFLLKGANIKLFHAHFINFPSSVALYMSQLSSVSYSCTAHANDIYKGCVSDIIHKIKKSKFIVTCTSANKQYLSGLLCASDNKSKIHHIYHGIDREKWGFRNERFTGNIFQILSVARLVEKKGLIYLLEAIKVLIKNRIPVQCSIVGDGPLFSQLNQFVKKNDLEQFVTFYGALPHLKVKEIYKTSDFFVLPCIISSDNDRDGLPNVLLEAMSLGIPIITTSVSAIPELIKDKVTGLLIAENDSLGIAKALMELINNPQLCQSLSENGRKIIEENFNIHTSTNHLVTLFSNP